MMGLPGKPDGIDGSEVEKHFLAGRIQNIADYCESDVVNTYRVWLRHEPLTKQEERHSSSYWQAQRLTAAQAMDLKVYEAATERSQSMVRR